MSVTPIQPPLRIVPSSADPGDLPVLERIAIQLKRIADRLEDDAGVFNEMVEKGNGLRA
jgi:hypothetical protein